MTMLWANPAAAQTYAIVNGTVALGDGSEPIPNGTVVIRDGRIVAAGAMRMKLPAGTQVIDANGKWVTPGIVAGFSRLGLADVDLAAEGADDTGNNGPFNAAIDVVPAINPLDTTVAVNRADGVTRAIVAPSAGKNIFAGQGAVIDTGADMDPITAPRKFQFVELGQTGSEKAGGSRASAHILFRNACRKRTNIPPTPPAYEQPAPSNPDNASGR
jgi:imidazolonepropionase-like amidohydrolase